jgi:plasmid stabilization system protein ParE
MKVEWSARALADLNRFEAFLRQDNPALSAVVANEIIAKVQILSHFPKLGRPIGGRGTYRQLILRVLNGSYIFRYGFDGEQVVILRVFHGREARRGVHED